MGGMAGNYKKYLEILKPLHIRSRLPRSVINSRLNNIRSQDGARIEAAFRRYFYRAPPEQTKDTYTLLVCHANVIRFFVCKALQFPPEGWLHISLNHGSITWVSILPNGNVVLRALSETGHMEPICISILHSGARK